MKPKFRLRLKDDISNTEADNSKQKVLKLHPDTKAKEKVIKTLQKKNFQVLLNIVKNKTGLFPSIKDARTINKQLDEPIGWSVQN